MANTKQYPLREEFKSIPFVDILIPYSEGFLSHIDDELSDSIKSKLLGSLLKELSSIAEVALHHELDIHKCEYNDFDSFVEKIDLLLSYKYPVLDETLKRKADDFSKHISKILHRFRKDCKRITTAFSICIKPYNLRIVDIDVGLGDGHNGESASSVTLSDGTKLIYKPRNIAITNAYNYFIDWVCSKLNIDLKTFRVLDCGEYGWLEFVNFEEVYSENDLQEYYYKAGVILAVTLLLGSKDYHRENIIASGINPVLIDHETIIQPFFNNLSIKSWDEQHKIPYFSVLESLLIINPNIAVSAASVGYGVTGMPEFIELVNRKVINPNTINSTRVVYHINKKLVEKNVPQYNGKHIFVSEYKKHFIDGFSVAYDLFLNSKEELKYHYSPLEPFKSKTIRYVWRQTIVYYKILKYLRSAPFMSNFEAYYSKLYELLSKAYNGEHMKEYKFILDFEMKQMLNGDIPIFNLNSSDNFLGENKSFQIFQYSCIENINQRINLLSCEHKNEQLEYISKWVNM